jgi:hypothetical protein
MEMEERPRKNHNFSTIGKCSILGRFSNLGGWQRKGYPHFCHFSHLFKNTSRRQTYLEEKLDFCILGNKDFI